MQTFIKICVVFIGVTCFVGLSLLFVVKFNNSNKEVVYERKH